VSSYQDRIKEYFATLPPILSREKAREILGNISVAYYYVLAGEKKIQLVKMGRKSLAVTASVEAYLLTLPPAEITPLTKPAQEREKRPPHQFEADQPEASKGRRVAARGR
jgi:hypothetical protein